ncbi:hypothetical protein [Xylophilus sp.]|uniref:hypothetical protein n=1 Tax=Xylophilus sp. TaxID=2653893 RepID=UPI0013BDF5FF|nr:hypothetical protein [Xylophilus sp.]KAF1050218.1 MAG: hypothetical protein GAK38_00244 [Xylophilus sp.]
MPRSHTSGRAAFWPTWRMPVALAVLTALGLLCALLGTGGWHVAAWCALVGPPAVCIAALLRARRQPGR